MDWIEVSVPVNKISLIYNPIERLNKQPWCWEVISKLARGAEGSIYAQSPYIIPTQNMMDILSMDEISVNREEIKMLTNSIYSSPNPLAVSGYMNKRKEMLDFGVRIYEYQGPGSIHAKSYTFDQRISAIGSFNLDSRSAFLSTESMVIIDSEEFAKKLEEEMGNYLDQSLMVAGSPDYSYLPNTEVEAGNVPLLKVILIKMLFILVKPFSYML